MKLTPEYLRKCKIGASPENQKIIAEALSSMGRLETAKPKSDQGGKAQDPKLGGSPAGLGFSITLIVFCRRKMDKHDNLRSACKPLVDRITETLGFRSDDDPRLSWHYAQVITSQDEGCLVKIAEL